MDTLQIANALQDAIPKRVREVIPKPLRRAGWWIIEAARRDPADTFPEEQWCRQVMNRDIDTVIRALPPQKSDAIEISGALRSGYPWRSYKRTSFPELDLCSDDIPKDEYDVVICEQVLEHTVDPWQASRALHGLCRPGGLLLVNTPFLIRIHEAPADYWRFTPDGLRILLSRAGFEVLWVRSWGNRACVRGNFLSWKRYRRWHSLRNEPDFPLKVWALCRSAS